MSLVNPKLLSSICFVAGFVSIVASIAIWFLTKDPDPAHGERFGIFVGLWAPTFFALSNRLIHMHEASGRSPEDQRR